ncbi:hypothetical protein OH77DRAFT_300017 [Trametes cingulata]|nr:hypothetical protein OH77DRAFT_300017 [Trametes cingulata]
METEHLGWSSPTSHNMDSQPTLGVFTTGVPVSVLPACAVCSRPSTLRCDYCVDGPAYCSSAHLQEHWQFHTDDCHVMPNISGWKDIAVPSAAPVEGNEGEYVRSVKKEIQGLFLEANSSDCGRFAPVTCYKVTLPNGRSFMVADVVPFLPDGHASLVLHFDRHKDNLDNPLHIHYCSRSFVTHDNWNKAVQSLITSAPGGPPARHLSWPGNLVFLKYADPLCADYVDMTDADLDTVRAYFEKLSMWR